MTSTRGTRPTRPKRWPISQEHRRKKAIELGKGALELIDEARNKVDRSRHKAEINLDLSDAARYVETIVRLMIEAGIGDD